MAQFSTYTYVHIQFWSIYTVGTLPPNFISLAFHKILDFYVRVLQMRPETDETKNWKKMDFFTKKINIGAASLFLPPSLSSIAGGCGILVLGSVRTGLPDFPWYKIPNRGKIYQMTIKIYEMTIKIYEMAIKYFQWP
jgi:hypothetical protein